MFITSIFKVVIGKSIKTIIAEQTFIVALKTVSNSIRTEFTLFGSLVEEEVVMTFKAVSLVVEVSDQAVLKRLWPLADLDNEFFCGVPFKVCKDISFLTFNTI